ncbi:MAG: hypothetical protein ABI480_09920, partial [Chitinophagaceae bacterium]
MKRRTSTRTNYKGAALFLLLLISFMSKAQTDLCTAATTLNSAPTCVNTGGSITGGASYTAILPAPGCGGTQKDVWYTFTAKSTSPTITLSGVSGGLTGNIRIQVYSGGCASMTSLGCSAGLTITPTLVVNTQYWIRIYSTTNANGTFSICIDDPAPANDDCAGAIALTPALTCGVGSQTTGNFYGSTVTAVAVAPCTGPVVYDMWYSFVANTDNATITLSGIGSNINTPRLQLFSGTCGSLVSVACSNSTLAASSLIAGTTYYVRAYATGGSLLTTPVNSGFTICVTYAPPPPPVNDECAGAVTLPVTGGCSNIAGTMISATASADPIAPCGGPVSYDVWYKFVATTTSTSITTSSYGGNIGGTKRVQILSGSCGSLTSVSCNSGSSAFVQATTVGTTYYIRVYETGAGAAPITNGDFNICVFSTLPLPPRFGNSYVNITKKTTGGVVQPGDVLEIRMTINHGSGTLFAPRYLDSIPTHTTMNATTADSIRVITNEGKTSRRYTPLPNVNDDAATYRPNPPVGDYNIRMNLGFAVPPGAPANNSIIDVTGATGTIQSSDKPKGGSGVLFATSFRVTVTGVVGDTIRLGAGKFIYRTSVGGPDITIQAIPYKILISNPMTLCSNSIGINNALEFGGTFGEGGALNRSTDLATPIAGYTFVNVTPSQGVGDGQYAIVKNMSPVNSTNRTANIKPTCGTPPPAQDCSNRMFGGFWDIDGDHTGTNNAIGNVPPSASDTSGYMLEVNTDYVAAEPYRQNLTGLCPNTYYEFSAWIRNICRVCGLDSNSTQTYKPGVNPNLTFTINGLDRYSTGEVDTLGWLKKGFVFKTDTAQTTAVFTIRNNSQGGGGNDWVMDDVSVATCIPNMKYSPSANPTVCVFNASTIYDTVSSFFDNYVYYKWQRSTDGGVTYVDITGAQGPAIPILVNGQWQYQTHYVIPPAQATIANNGDMYRVVAATSISNLGSNNCIVTNGINFLTLNVLNCGTPLKTDIISFNGKLVGDMANLSWTTSKEDEQVTYKIERSNDGASFTLVGLVNGNNNGSSDLNQYSLVDATP